MVSDSDPDPVDYWIQKLELYHCDLCSLEPDMDVTDGVIHAAQRVLKSQFQVGGCQSPALAHSLQFRTAPSNKLCIQVLNTGMLFIIIHNYMHCAGLIEHNPKMYIHLNKCSS